MLHLSQWGCIVTIGIAFAGAESWEQQVAEGVRLRRAGHYQEAAKVLEDALTRNGHDDRAMTATLLNLGEVYTSEGRYADAARVLTEARAWAEKEAERAMEAQILSSLGELARLEARYVEAATLDTRAAEMARASGMDEKEEAAALHNLALVYQDTGRYGEAEPLLRRAIEAWEQAKDPRAAAAYNSMADLRLRQKRYTEAETCFRRALDAAAARFGAAHPDVAAILVNRSELFERERRYAEAEADLRRAFEILSATVGPRHPRTIACLNGLGLAAYYQGRYREAEERLTKSLELGEQVYGPGHPRLAATLTNLGVVYRTEARYADSERALGRALAIEKTMKPQDANTAGTMMEYARLLRRMKRKQEAGEMEARARAIAVGSAATGFAGNTVDVTDLRR
jgi:tetratricopeptide (TPR) repeat protein